MYALCYASGHIVFRRSVPKDGTLLPIARGPAKTLKAEMEAVARHAYDARTLLVPGLPEAPDQAAALKALTKFKIWIRPSFEKKGLAV